MNKIDFSDIFSVEYLEIITKYKNRINELLSMYDIVIFMARKAICFYKAMVINEEITINENCMVLSSRVLSYNIMNKFKGKRVAIIDDVVVKGKTISYSKKIFEENDINVDIHFVACEKEFIDKVSFVDSIKSPFIYLSDTSICQLSNYITEYIEASMIPYNVDQPIYTVEFVDLEEYERFFWDKNDISNITDGLQKQYGIQNMSVHFKSEILKQIFENDFDVDNAYLKIRFMHYADSLKLIAVPFVLLPELSYEKLDAVFKKLFGNNFDEYILCGNLKEEYENKLKVLQYTLSDTMFYEYSKIFNKDRIIKDIENEVMQFVEKISERSLIQKNSRFMDLTYDNQVKGFENHFAFDKFLSDTYDYIFSDSDSNNYFCDTYGIGQKIITLTDLNSFIAKKGDSAEKYSVSTIIDILIDKGILVPAIVHGINSNSIIRAYKCGEIFHLTKKGIDLFAYMLDRYVNIQEGKPLDKIEFEKLCVLFFKNAGYRNGLFSVRKSFDDDCFSICYSKFGPRVSSCNKKYKVASKSALATILEDRGEIYLSNGKYMISTANAPNDKKWTIIAENFAITYFHLFQCFKSDTVKNQYVHTYNDFLTLLAIGSDRKNQMFSLMAELYLMTRIEMDNSLSEILNQMDRYSSPKRESDKPQYQGIMDGIGSGLWKYNCFCKEDLVDLIFIEAGKINSDIRFIKEDYLAGMGENDENPLFLKLLDECGYLLYEIAYLFNYAQKRYSNAEMNKVFKKSAFFNSKFQRMRHAIKSKCKDCSEEELINDLCVLKKRAVALINKCDLYIDEAAFSDIKIHSNVWGLYHFEQDLQRYGIEINVHSHKENDIIRKCIFLRYDNDKSFEEQLSKLIEQYAVIEKNVLLMLVNIENPYEGMFESFHTATGDYFKNIVRETLTKSNYNVDSVGHKIIICTRKNLVRNDICLNNFILKYDCDGEVCDSYKYWQYILLKERKVVMGNSNQGGTIIFNAPVSINGGIVEANGSENTITQNVNKPNLETFFENVQSMNLEVLGNDSKAEALVKSIKEDATKKNQDGVLEKLRELAISVGSSVFSKIVSTLIIDVMKVKGYFPF